MKKALPCLLVLLFSVPAYAQTSRDQVPEQDRDSLPNTFLRGKPMIEYHPTPGGPHAAQKMAKAAALSSMASTTSSCKPPSLVLSCVDTITNFIGTFDAPGVYLDGTPRNTWEFSMVGRAPTHNGTTTFNAPIIPVTISLLNADGTPRSDDH